MTLNISIPHELESKINEQINSGLYENANALIHDALNVFFSRQEEGEVLALFTKQRLNDIKERGEQFEEADLSQLKQIRQQVNQKHIVE